MIFAKSTLAFSLLLVLPAVCYPTQKAKRAPFAIESLLGKSVNDDKVHDFIKDSPDDVKMSSFPDLDAYYYTIKKQGVSLMFNGKDRLTTIFLYSEGVDGYKQFAGMIPHGLRFADTRSDVTKKLGLPARSGGGVDSLLGKIPIWDKYHFSVYSLHVSYRPTGTIDLITLMEKTADPDFK